MKIAGMRMLKLWVGIFLVAASTGVGAREFQAAHEVIARTLGRPAPNLVLKPIPKEEGPDVYEYQASGGKLLIKASSSVAACRGFYDYLRSNHLGMVGWEGARLRIPKSWPDAPATRVKTPFKIRHCYNVVTSGYTTPYWTWERWERELDWLALHGYNMIMAPVATEAIATRVWRKMGFTQEEVDKFYVGPAHLPWQRMGNIQGVGGTLPQDWHRDQVALQKKILERLRELDMEPVVQSFAGFVPPDIKRLHPEVPLHGTLWNAGFPPAKRPVVVMPDQQLFKDISKMYMTEWRKEFGDARFYLVDSFNEMHLPKTDRPTTELLADYGKNTYEAMRAGDPDAIWVIQGWMFNYQRNIWNKDTVKALLGSVPDDRMLVLDYANDYNDNWDEFGGFYGKPWVMGYVPNMGGKTAYTGKMDFYAAAVSKMLVHPERNNNVGFTISGEGLENNQVLYELMSDTAWSAEAIDLDVWLEKYSRNRYGSYPDGVRKAWELYRQTCYGTFTPHPKFGWQMMECRYGSVNRDERFTEGVLSFLSCKDRLKAAESYRDDAVEMTAIALSLKADEWFVLAQRAHDLDARDLFDQASARGLELLTEVDRLLESHSLDRLDRWIALARQHSASEELNDFYESNARRIVTVWGPPVNDYSARMWSGLIRDFYRPRMAAYLDGLKSGKGFRRGEWEEKWVMSTGVSKISPYENPVDMADKLLKKACAEKMPPMPELSGVVAGRWDPSQLSDKEWTTVEWEFDPSELANLRGVLFKFTKGSNLLNIQSVSLVLDGNEVAKDRHNGSTGYRHKGNYYKLRAPEAAKGNNGCMLRAVIRPAGGTNSYGQVELIGHDG